MKTFTILLCFFLCSCSSSSFVSKTKDLKDPLEKKSILIPALPVSDEGYRIVLNQEGNVVSTTPNRDSSASGVILYIILGCTVGCGLIYAAPYFLKKIKKPDVV
jgi:hypothetical protein